MVFAESWRMTLSPMFNHSTVDERLEALKIFQMSIESMFGRAFEICCERENTVVDSNKPFEFVIPKQEIIR